MERAVAQGKVAQGKVALSEECARRIVAVYDAILKRGFAFHAAQPPLARRAGARGRTPKRAGHNLLERLRDHKADVLRFVFDLPSPGSPPTPRFAFAKPGREP